MRVVTGCNHKLEWLLDPWIFFFRKFNPTMPFTFADFGLTIEGKEKVEAAGGVIVNPGAPKGTHVYDLLMLKPVAMLMIPGDSGLWLDIDAQVHGDVSAYGKFKFAAQLNTGTWNSGIFKYVKHPVMDLWANLNRKDGEHDEHVFLRATKQHPVYVHRLNWRWAGNWKNIHRNGSLCTHWLGKSGKLYFRKLYDSAKQVVVYADSPSDPTGFNI
jgi:hypothetical protein